MQCRVIIGTLALDRVNIMLTMNCEKMINQATTYIQKFTLQGVVIVQLHYVFENEITVTTYFGLNIIFLQIFLLDNAYIAKQINKEGMSTFMMNNEMSSIQKSIATILAYVATWIMNPYHDQAVA